MTATMQYQHLAGVAVEAPGESSEASNTPATSVVSSHEGLALRAENISLTAAWPSSGRRHDCCGGGARGHRRRASNPCGGDGQQLLVGVSACCLSGELTAVIGPTGAGKTSLLGVLCGHRLQPGSRLSGRVSLLCGGGAAAPSVALRIEPAGVAHRRLYSYVPQHSVLLPGLTVRQMLMYAAALRLPLPAHQLERRVQGTLLALADAGLLPEECGDALVDGVELSGGQRKLINVALGLVTDAAVLVLDEPTTGLDNASAEILVRNLQRLAVEPRWHQALDHACHDGSNGSAGGGSMDDGQWQRRRTVVVTLHQPSSAVLKHVDQLLLLAAGA
jgi:ABC-type Mn2+/Zn2+ transport system ATPase subunit